MIMRMTGSRILLALRDHRVERWHDLCRHFGLDPRHPNTAHNVLRKRLDQLRGANLVSFDDTVRGDDFEIQITENWTSVQTVLDLSLVQLADFDPRDSLMVKPFFGLPSQDSQQSDVFVLMPFASSLKPVYNDHIRTVAANLGLTISRADDFFNSGAIMTDVWHAVCGAQIIIADCTQRNPNVFYEIGLAHSIGKRVILITQDPNDVPFDVRHLRYIKYDFTPRGMKDFEDTLTKTIEAALGSSS